MNGQYSEQFEAKQIELTEKFEDLKQKMLDQGDDGLQDFLAWYKTLGDQGEGESLESYISCDSEELDKPFGLVWLEAILKRTDKKIAEFEFLQEINEQELKIVRGSAVCC